MESTNAWFGTGSRGLVVPRMAPVAGVYGFAGMQGFDLAGPARGGAGKSRPHA